MNKENVYNIAANPCYEKTSALYTRKPVVPEEKQEKRNGIYSALIITAFILIVLALVGLVIAGFISFANIKAVQADLEMLTPNRETLRLENNFSIIEMFEIFNKTLSSQIAQLIEDFTPTLALQGMILTLCS